MSRETNIDLRKGTAAAWRSVNPILEAGEPGFEVDTKKLKFGDGTTAWNDLAYFHVDGGELDDGGIVTFAIPSMMAVAWGDPHFYVVKGTQASGPQIAGFGDQVPGSKLMLYLKTSSHELSVVHENQYFPPTGAQTIKKITITHNGNTQVIDSAASIQSNSNFGPVKIVTKTSSYNGNHYLDVNLSWNDISGVREIGGVVGLVLRNLVSSGSAHNGSDGVNHDGIGTLAAAHGLTTQDFIDAAAQGPGSSAWNKLVLDATTLSTLSSTVSGISGSPPTTSFGWDPLPHIDLLPSSSSSSSSSAASSSSSSGIYFRMNQKKDENISW